MEFVIDAELEIGMYVRGMDPRDTLALEIIIRCEGNLDQAAEVYKDFCDGPH